MFFFHIPPIDTSLVNLSSLLYYFADPDVIDTDSAYGGFGLIVRFGARYAF